MKNLVVFHLESLSWEIFYQQIDRLNNLRNIMSKSVVFKNFFSSATSSIMAVSDFLYGNNFELDNCTSFDDLKSQSRIEKSLLSALAENNYRILGTGYPNIWRDDINNYKIWDYQNIFQWTNNYNDFLHHIDNFLAPSSPFFLYVWDIRSHLFYTDNIKSSGKNFLERIEIGYSCLDNTIKEVFDFLIKKNLIDNTIILGFGDHGDEFWTHSLNEGFCHSNEPYSDLIYAPAFIYEYAKDTANLYNLISLVDLKSICLDLLEIDNSNLFDASGKNSLKKLNDFVFSQNLFANQNSLSPLNKAYSVTNKNYHLMISKNGLEMYAYKIDSTNHSNLLKFFDLDSNGKLTFIDQPKFHPHFKTFFVTDQIEDIVNNFNTLKGNLKNRVVLKNKLIASDEKNLFNMDNFNKIKSGYLLN